MKYIKYYEGNTEKVLIIENEVEVAKDFFDEIKEITHSIPSLLTGVFYRRTDEILQAINNANIIALQSMFIQPEQVDKFMKLFYSLKERKKVIIKLREKDKIRLTSNPLYIANSQKHEIVFIYE
jgi:hypothetical protein